MRRILLILCFVLGLPCVADAAHIYNPSTGGGGAPSGPAGGDLGGTYPNPTVTSGAHLGAATVPNASLVTAPITACGTDINAACTQVTSGAHLGAGTVPNNAISGWPVTFWAGPAGFESGQVNGGVNTLIVEGFTLPIPVTFSKLTIKVQTSDAVNSYDLCLYDSGGNLKANRGAGTLPSTGIQSLTMAQGSQTLQPGLYFWAFTGNSATAAVYDGNAANGAWCYNQNTNYGSSSGGACPVTITPPSKNIIDHCPWFNLN